MIVRIAALATAACVMALAGSAAHARDAGRQYAQAGSIDTSADGPPPVRRARTQIEVRPARPMHRECTSWLEQEFRPSGTVIVPRMRCAWVR